MTTTLPAISHFNFILAASLSPGDSLSWIWPVVASVGGIIVLAGLVMEEWEHKKIFLDINDFRRSKKIAEWGRKVLIFGIVIEIVVGFAFAAREEIASSRNDPRNHPITSISAIVTFRIRGDFSPPPLPYSNLLEQTGAGIIFLQGTNISDKIPSISLGADAADISILNLIPNNEHPDTHDVVIKFHDSGDIMYGHFFNKWMWQNNAGFFDDVKGLMVEMRQIGSNVDVLSGNVVVTANDLKWEFPLPVQKQRLGIISSKIIKNTKGQEDAAVMPLDLLDMTGRPLGHFDGK